MPIVSLSHAVSGLLTVQLLAAVWAVAFRLPYEFGGHGVSDRIFRNLWTRGTALSAPIVFLAVGGLARWFPPAGEGWHSGLLWNESPRGTCPP